MNIYEKRIENTWINTNLIQKFGLADGEILIIDNLEWDFESIFLIYFLHYKINIPLKVIDN